jgi:hypothetical protein
VLTRAHPTARWAEVALLLQRAHVETHTSDIRLVLHLLHIVPHVLTHKLVLTHLLHTLPVSPPRIVPQGGEIGECCDKRSNDSPNDSHWAVIVRQLPNSEEEEDGHPLPLPGYSRVQFVWSQ